MFCCCCCLISVVLVSMFVVVVLKEDGVSELRRQAYTPPQPLPKTIIS